MELNFFRLLYTGKDDNFKIDETITNLLKPYHNKNYMVFIDSYYTSMDLFKNLLSLGFGCTGTLRKNRKGLPKKAISQKLEVGESRLLTFEKHTLYIWQDKRKMLLLSTVYGGQMMQIQRYDPKNPETPLYIKKPRAIDHYNNYSHGVDKSNQNSQYYHNDRRNRWYKKIFFQLIEVSICNSYILYKILNKQKRFKILSSFEYRIQLLEKLLERYVNESISEVQSEEAILDIKTRNHRLNRCKERHFPIQITPPKDDPKKDMRRECSYCSTRGRGKRVRTDLCVSNVVYLFVLLLALRNIILNIRFKCHSMVY